MKKALLVLALFAVFAGMAAATETRVATFGPASMFINDYTDIYFLPANAVYYPRLIAAEMGASFPVSSDYGWSEGSAAMLFANQDQTFGVVGFDINHEVEGTSFLSGAVSGVNAYFGSTVPTPDNRFHVFYAKKLNNLTAGLHLGWAGASTMDEASDTFNAYSGKFESSSGLWLINGEVMMEASENASAELGIALIMPSFMSEATETWRTPPPVPGANYTYTVENDGGMGLELELRAEYGMSDNLKLIPIIGFGTNSIGYKDNLAATGVTWVPYGGKMSTSEFGGAFGANYKPADNVTIVGGLFMGSSKTTIEDTNFVFSLQPVTPYPKEEYGTFTFPGFCAGLEVDLLKWLILRAGAAKTLISTSEKLETNATKEENSYTSAPYFYAFGLGFKFGKLVIDAKLNNNTPYSLGYFMSGIDQAYAAGFGIGTQPITSIGMTYTF
jgi:hypothetical protein